MDFNATKDEALRGYAVERAIEVVYPGAHSSAQDVLNVAKMIEDYITTGEVTGTIQAAVEEGYSEGRLEVKQLIETEIPVFDSYGNETFLDLTALFVNKGWMIDPRPQED